MLTASQLIWAAWRVPRVALGCGRRVKSSSRIGNGGTTSPGLQSTSPFGTSTREGEVRRSLSKMQKCRLLLETISVGEPTVESLALAGGEGYVFVRMDSAAWLVASSSDGKCARCVMRGRGRVGCRLRSLHCGESPFPVLLPLGTSSPCPCCPCVVLDVSPGRGSLLNPTGLFPLSVMVCLVLPKREIHHPSPGCARSDAVGCLQRLLPGFWLEFSLTSFDY